MTRVLGLFVIAALGAAACALVTDTRGLMSNPSDASVADASALDVAVDAAGDAPSFTSATPCPNKGGSMANVGTHCIDVVEVSMASYDEFLASFPDAGAVATNDQPAFCAFNTDLRTGDFYAGAADRSKQPVAEVDWCDAFAFCRWAGKRLCGGRGGGETPYGSFGSAADSQWQYACSSGGDNAWVYGNSYQGATCRGRDFDDASDYLLESRRAPECRAPTAPFLAVYDLNGNAAEWEDSCESSIGASDRCRVRGGSRQSDADGTRCAADDHAERNVRSAYIGFRCCWP